MLERPTAAGPAEELGETTGLMTTYLLEGQHIGRYGAEECCDNREVRFLRPVKVPGDDPHVGEKIAANATFPE